MGKRTVQDFIVSGFGFVTSIITAVLLVKFQEWTGFALYSLSYVFMLPVGAILSGAAGATGYYAGARLFNHRPSRLLLFNMLAVSISTFLLIHYLQYATLTIDGKTVADYVSFTHYLDVRVRATSLTFGRSASGPSTGELGSWGYAYAMLQVVGFSLGGIGVYRMLTNIPFCARCNTYLRKTSTNYRYVNPEDASNATQNFAAIAASVSHADMESAKVLFDATGTATVPKNPKLRLKYEPWQCRSCTTQYLRCAFEKHSNDSWSEIPKMGFGEFVEHQSEIEKAGA